MDLYLAGDALSNDEPLQSPAEIPGAGAVWLIESGHTETLRQASDHAAQPANPAVGTCTRCACAQVRHVSARLLKLQEVFGDGSGADVDVAAMLLAEPRHCSCQQKLCVI